MISLRCYPHAQLILLMVSSFIFRHMEPFVLGYQLAFRRTGSCRPFTFNTHQIIRVDRSSRMFTTNLHAVNKQNDDDSITVNNNYNLKLRIPTPEDMQEIAALLSISTRSGDTILLDGDLGAGKTCFSRGFIQARSGYEGRITSPTYLLSNEYLADEGVKIHHMDLYRLNGTEEDLVPLDLENVFTNGIALVEWPERLVKRPKNRLDVTLTVDLKNCTGVDRNMSDDEEDSRSRIMMLVPHGDRWTERLQFYETEGYFEDLLLFDDE